MLLKCSFLLLSLENYWVSVSYIFCWFEMGIVLKDVYILCLDRSFYSFYFQENSFIDWLSNTYGLKLKVENWTNQTLNIATLAPKVFTGINFFFSLFLRLIYHICRNTYMILKSFLFPFKKKWSHLFNGQF